MSATTSPRNKSDFVSYDVLKKYVRQNSIKTKAQYLKHRKENCMFMGKYLPCNPSTFYTKGEWISWSMMLRGEVYKKSHLYYSYDECKKTISKYNLLSKSDFINNISDIIKEDIRIPYNPYSVYRDEWISWMDFLNTDNIFYNSKSYRTYDEAKLWACSQDFKSTKQWRNLSPDDIPHDIPKKPNRTYKNNGWINWYDFLGIDVKNKMSYGESIISDILKYYGVKFFYDRSLKDCKNISKLRFDFYLPDYNTCIEFDGIQHFKPISIFGGLDGFNETKIRDDIKNKWCNVNKIKLIRFNYLQTKENIEGEILEVFNLKRKTKN